MRADRKPQPPPSMSPGTRSRGRPLYYGFDEYMQVWLFVRKVMVRTRRSANRVCCEHTFHRIVGGRGGSGRQYSVQGQTLRSLYQQAVRILQDEQKGRDAFVLALRQAGASGPQEAKLLPIATLWQEELQRRLALPG
jgi:hypothetical protein